MEDKISIIIPVYNVEQFIRKCVKSVLNQTHKNIEIILVDDGSPDNCGKIIDAFAKMDERIKVIHQENKGLCGARNAGLSVATGKYIGFVDPDDWISSDMFEYLLQNLLKYDGDISACRYYRVIPGKKTTVKSDGKIYVYNKDEAIKEIVTKFTLRTIFCNKLFKKELFDDIKFPEDRTFEGTYMMHKIFEKADKIVFLPDGKYFYYKYEDSIVNTKNVKNQCCYILSYIERYNDLHEKYPNLIKKMLKSIIKESLKLLKICYKKRDEIPENIDLIKQIGEFIKDNIDLIKEQKYIKKVTLRKLRFFETVKTRDLLMAHYLKKLGKKFKKYKKKIKKIKKKLKKLKKKYIKKPLKRLINKVLNLPPKIKQKTIGVSLEDLTEEDKEIFEKLHKCQLEILDEFDRVCRNNNLKYFLYGGTLLGAVRHKGFIPWDDDIDIIMPREDFDKLEECCKKELNERFFYQSNKVEPDFLMLFAKIRMKNTYVREPKWKDAKMHQGIFIDILPLDLFPETSKNKKKVILEKFNILNCACQTGRCISKHLASKIMYKWYTRFPNEVLQAKRENFIKKQAKQKNTSLVCSFGSHYRPLKKRVLKREWFEHNDILMEFEGKQYPVPNGWEDYLIHLFGQNYMELPPVEKRINHFNFYDVEFDVEENDKIEV